MARPKVVNFKKKKVIEVPPSIPSVVAPPIPTVEATPLRLTDVVRLTLCRYEAEVRAARHQLAAEQAQLREYVAVLDKDGVIAKRQAIIYTLLHQVSEMQARYDKTRQEVEKDLKINLKEYSFDDESGLLHHVGTPKSE